VFPVYFRNDYVGIEEDYQMWETKIAQIPSRFSAKMRYLTEFCETWMDNLVEQGFLEPTELDARTWLDNAGYPVA
jgi:hypothetical protein